MGPVLKILSNTNCVPHTLSNKTEDEHIAPLM